MEIKYKNLRISTDSFQSFSNRNGLIAKVRAEDGSKYNMFAFAVSGLLLRTKNLNTTELVNESIEVVRFYIDKGLSPYKEYTFEYDGDRFNEVENPGWWVSSKIE